MPDVRRQLPMGVSVSLTSREAVFLVVLAALSIVFGYTAISVWRYHRRLYDPNDEWTKRILVTHPRWLIFLKYALPVTIVQVSCTAVAVALVFILVLLISLNVLSWH